MKSIIDVLTHSSIKINGDGRTVYVDVFDMNDEPHDADFILVTHEHYDHFSPKDIIKASKENTVLVAPISMKDKAETVRENVADIEYVEPGMSYDFSGLNVETIPAYNVNKKFHPKSAEWVGYIIESEGERIYIAGDTDATEEGANVKCDIALVPVGGTYTMTVEEAAELVNKIEPKFAIPTHYGNIVGEKTDGEKFIKLVNPAIKVETRI